MEDLTKLIDTELSEGIEILSEQAAEAWNEQIQFGDSGPGSARKVSAYLAYQAEYERRWQQKLADRALSPVPVIEEDDCPF